MAEELIEIEGLDEICHLLESAPKEAVPKALLAGFTAWGEVMQAAIVSVTPVRQVRSGGDEEYPALIEDLAFTVTLDSTFRGGFAEVGFGKQAYVARFVEYGHRQVSHGDSKQTRKELGQVAPHPFMRPAADAVGEEALDAFVSAVYVELAAAGLADAA